MDPIVRAFEDRRKELQAEIKHLDQTLAAYRSTGSHKGASTFVLTDEHRDAIKDYVNKQAGQLGVRALDVCDALELPEKPVREYLRKSTQFKQTNTGKRNQRWMVAKPGNEPSRVQIAGDKVKGKPKRKARRSNQEGSPADRKRKVRAVIKNYVVGHRLITIKNVVDTTGVSDNTVREVVKEMTEAGQLIDRGFDRRMSKPGSRSSRVWESRIYEAPKLKNTFTTTVIPGEGIRK